jgi:putative DNA primase/helicase
VVLPEIKTNPGELLKFHTRLMKSAPNGYYPFYFPLEPNDKEPIENKSWKNNRKTIHEALYLMKKGQNIGICATGKDPLCIVDRDDLTQAPEIKPTLQITSRKRIGRHDYYFALDGTAKKNIPTKNAGEVRAVWYYVVAPGSYVPCSEEEINRMPAEERPYAGQYTVNNELPVSEITFDELPEVYRIRYAEMRHDEIQAVIREVGKRSTGANKGGKYRSALWDLDITDVSGVRETGNRKVPMPNIIHGSETGHNCSVNNGLMHCWRHYVAHNAFSYMAILAGVSSCERSGLPHGGRYFGVDSQDGFTVFEVWKYAKNSGLIPENDPIPSAALSYYAIQKGVCKKEDLTDGYRLNDIAYTITLLMGKREGLNFGRQ